MRIISGNFGGRKFNPPAKIPARPTTDLAKEGLFNILANMMELEDVNVLELFAGTGNISYEFASRGAASLTLIEKDKNSVEFIKQTFQLLRFDDFKVIQGDVLKLIKGLTKKYDIIFADPPYALPQMPLLPDLIIQSNLLEEEGILIIEHTHNVDFAQHPNFIKAKKYGDSYFSFFQSL